jgi:5'-nucleotidase
MRVLLTNDDGLRAPGIEALYHALVDSSQVEGTSGEFSMFTVAPETVQSATSHGVTFHTPLMVRSVHVSPKFEGVSVDGRPADCVKLAVSNIWPEKFGEGSRPDIVISGMNAGANVGINTIYSGTVAAALEAAFLGIPSIAVSLHLGCGTPDFALAAKHGRRAIDAVLKAGFPSKHACVSINIPITEIGMSEEQTRAYPLKVCPMNTHGLVDKYERRVSPGGDVYYWAAGHGLDFHSTDDGSDVQEIFKRSITITPLRYDLTKKSVMSWWRERIG